MALVDEIRLTNIVIIMQMCMQSPWQIQLHNLQYEKPKKHKKKQMHLMMML